MNRKLERAAILSGVLAGAGLALSCNDAFDTCGEGLCHGYPNDGGAGGSAGGSGGGGTAGSGGVGGQPECMNDASCTDPAKAHCQAGSCVPCDASAQCAAGNPTLPACDQGTCVACKLGEEAACAAPETCDLVGKTCVQVAPGSVANCKACTNDVQCATGLRCIPMDFQGAAHGYYCLGEPSPTCDQPFAVTINEASISGAAAVDYCAIDEDLATCEAVLALVHNWTCSGTDGMCSPDGVMPEQPVPGAICAPVGTLGDRCTYACDATQQCPNGMPLNTCGTGNQNPPGWCGG